MADIWARSREESKDAVKYCLQYFTYNTCSIREKCPYIHKNRSEIEVAKYTPGEQYFFGRTKPTKVCRYFLRGHCIHESNCRFIHDQGSQSEPTRVEEDTANANASNIMLPVPSTSAQPDATSETDNEPHQKENNNKKEGQEDCIEEGACSSPPLTNEDWVNAPEFIPKMQIVTRTYAEALCPEGVSSDSNALLRLCPFFMKEGVCKNPITCLNAHGERCDMCQRWVLHPYNEELKKRHRQECLKQHEKNMELSFAIARSKEKSCGVCFEVIMEKASGEQRFGILPNCNHCFCLTCIRKWRQARQFENKIIRACPECRVTSDFVCPSAYWVDTKEDKDRLIDEYKKALSTKDCKYFKKGEGKCPFGNKCFYLHAFPDGRKCDVGPPPRQRRHRNNEHDIDVLQVMLWDFLDERDFQWNSLADDLADDLEDLVSFFTDSDESDWSDYELFLD